MYDEKIIIPNNGKIDLPLIGTINTLGLSLSKFTEILNKKYSKYLRRPNIVVLPRSIANQRIYVAGEVISPGSQILRGNLTILQAVMRAGGPTKDACSDSTYLIRLDNKTSFLCNVLFAFSSVFLKAVSSLSVNKELLYARVCEKKRFKINSRL